MSVASALRAWSPRMRLLSLALLTGLAAGCGGNQAGQGPEPAGASASNETPVVIDGSSTVYPISMAAQEAYDEKHPGARIVVDLHGTGGGFDRYIQGEVDIVDASRPAKAKEEQAAKDKGFDWTQFLVGHDGITIAVHKENDWVDSLSVAQLKQLFAPDSTITTWKQLNPAWPDRAIKLYSPDDDSGTFDFFTEAIVGKTGAQRNDIQASSDDNTLVTGVSNDRDGLGYFGFAYYSENQDKLRAVPVRLDETSEPVTPTLETIYAKQYKPLSRPLFIYVKKSAAQRQLVADFVTHYLENVKTFAESAGFVAPTDEERQANAAALKELVSTPGPAQAG